jgi:tRNA dimethylallyltransferase
VYYIGMSAPSFKKAAVCLMGPTATGKTDLAVALSQHFPFEIISVDSSLVYRGLDIGSAKPSLEVLRESPHRLIDIREPNQPYSAADFSLDAEREMRSIFDAGNIPLLVGGTMFYFHSLEFGLSPLPSSNPEIRARLSERAAREGWAKLHEELTVIDPTVASRINVNDTQRLQRALEIYEITGEAPSAVQAKAPRVQSDYRFIKVALIPEDRAWLHARIEMRFRQMLDQGFMAEVERLKARRELHADLPYLRTVGYRQAWEYLTGAINYTEMTERAIAATRQLAKRQLTWLRSYPGIRPFDPKNSGLFDEVLGYLRHELQGNDQRL